ncbi:hypothetical protein K2173_023350 [Erythroxylum novogranatense]|uniref:RIN4 pathogenic type III effector avirulence factor Avr cleavage site domain-containing protein n=1 Tax=Erythroxylum novogranatense TaxID=1862640 RepID=A0AAV8TVP8_9ROSI|nr:hypothetical protein K2173_023350 [Erythroxylum novogranatense]
MTTLADNEKPLPKFGEWDVNDPASAEGFTVIFSKARDGKKNANAASQRRRDSYKRNDSEKPTKNRFCCFP